jgi:CBS domain-containing protein
MAGEVHKKESCTLFRYWRQGVSRHGDCCEAESAMKKVTEILRSKPERTVQTIAPSASVLDAIKLMAERNIGALVVMEDEKMLGIITERDYARKVILKGRSSKDTPVREIMTSPVVCVRPDQTNEECMELMTGKRVRHLPVFDGGNLIGLVSIGDLVKDIISEQRQTIQQLEHYIMGQRG